MSSVSGTSRRETERTKLIQEKCQTLLTQMLRDEDNKYCVDCDAKGPRWASWNLGVFLCIRCAGIHRNLGVHISRVKSVNLDTWTPEQVISLQQMGNSRARAVYEAQLPDGFRRPQTDTALESFIRAKYEHKKYLAREWVPPSPPKVDWAKEIDDELEKQKRKKKTAQTCTALGLSHSIISGPSCAGDKKSSTNVSSAKSVPLPAPLPKPKHGQSGSSPKTHRISMSSSMGGGATSRDHTNVINDLLSLSTPTKAIQNNLNCSGGVGAATAGQNLQNDSFSGFLSATPNSCNDHRETNATIVSQNCNNNQQQQQNSLAKEEEDFFKQGSLGGINEKNKSGKLTKDSILALYGTASNANVAAHNPQHMNFGQQQQQQMFPAGSGGGFSGGMVAPGYMGGAATGVIPQQHHHQFMTPPNSASMYNSPVMTAPTAFTASGMHMIGGGVGVSMGGQQFGQQSIGGGMLNLIPGSVGSGGIMATGQPTQSSQSTAAANLMHTNQTLLSGMTMMAATSPPQQLQQQYHHHQQHQMFGGLMMGSINMEPMAAAFQTPTAAATAVAPTTNLNQQFGNLNIGNVWQ